MTINQRILSGAAVVVIAAAVVAGCRPSTTDTGQAKIAASSTAAAQVKTDLKQITAKCGTSSAAGQIAAVKDMKSKAGRATLWTRCGVPAAKRSAVESQALTALEAAHLVSGGHPARVTYFTVTLPGIIQRNQS
jgi:hypothetical protein